MTATLTTFPGFPSRGMIFIFAIVTYSVIWKKHLDRADRLNLDITYIEIEM
jgi:hypothetical protein